jgi:DhnA family fructose-bisphosphate aldolase class Ia
MAAVIGGSWTGTKSMTVTSGPGFSLMMENLGLAAMMETPCVVVNVQRGGPSTGLPTMVGQADGMQARWGSHGDYEIIALAHRGQTVDQITVAVEDAIRLNASAITLSVFVGADGERETLLNLARLIDAGHQYGIPVLAVTAVGKDMARDARYLGLACRISAELGAHMVKTYFCDGFEEIVRNTPVPIVIAGGKKRPERDALQMAHDAIRAGACGVDMGRNIFQSDSPVGMIKAVRAIVQKDAGLEEAFAIYEEEKAGRPALEPQPA